MQTYPRPVAISRAFAHDFIERERQRPQSNRVLHGHPGPANWTEMDESPEALLEQRLDHPRSAAVVYGGFPFCIPTAPKRCGFCLFPSEDYRGRTQLDDYLKLYEKECRLLKPFYGADKVGTMYLGGGTPNLMRPEHYKQVMGYMHDLYGEIPDGIEITLEGLPPLFTEEKIKAMAEVGINRVSMGAQQIQEHLVELSGRPQTKEQVLKALELCHKYDMANSLDLIFGWPDQTIADMLHDLRVVVESNAAHLTHYRLNIAGRSAFAKKDMRERQPSIDETIEMYHVAGQYLRSEGWEQVTVYDWRRIPNSEKEERLGEYSYEQMMHRFDETEAEESGVTRQVCGIGYAGISFHLNGMEPGTKNWKWMNTRSTTVYKEKVEAGRLPVERGFMHTAEDVRLDWLFQTMQTMRIDVVRYRVLFGHDIRDVLGHVIDELEDRGWVEKRGGSLYFIGDGQYHVPMLQALVAATRVGEITGRGASRLDRIPVATEVA